MLNVEAQTGITQMMMRKSETSRPNASLPIQRRNAVHGMFGFVGDGLIISIILLNLRAWRSEDPYVHEPWPTG
jgi:hypothetical protein